MHMYVVLAVGLFSTVMLSGVLREKNKEEISIKEYVIAAAFFLLLMFWFMSFTGVLESGYHLVDDHEAYTISRDFGQYGFWGTMYKWISNDLHSRFRFTYFLIRITECYFFRDNFVLWHAFQTGTAAAGLFLSYIFARRMKCTIWGAYVFAVIIFVGGGQSAVWWRLGPQENLGTILLMLTLLSLRNYLERNKTGNLIPAIIFTIFLGGIKEAFLLILPLLPIWLVYWEINKNGQEINLPNAFAAFKKYRIYSLTTYLAFLVDIAIILLYVGTNKHGYAGIDVSYGIWDYIRGIKGIVDGRLGLYIKVTIIGILFLLVPIWVSCVKERQKLFRLFLQMLVPVLSAVYFLGVQFILHAESGMYERYLLPSTVIFAYFWLIDMYRFVEFLRKFMGGYYMFVIFMALAMITGVNDEDRARGYAEDGKNTTIMLSKVVEYADETSNIIVGIGYEEDFAAAVYLQEKYNIKSTYNLFYTARKDNIVHDGYICDADEKETITLEEAQIFMGYSHAIIPIMEEYSISQQNFELYTYGDYALYIRKESTS